MNPVSWRHRWARASLGAPGLLLEHVCVPRGAACEWEAGVWRGPNTGAPASVGGVKRALGVSLAGAGRSPSPPALTWARGEPGHGSGQSLRLRVLAALRRRGHCAEGPSVATRCPEAPESSDPSSHLPTAMAGCTHLCSPSGKPWLPRLLLHGRPQPCAMPKPSLCAVSAAWAFSRGRGPGSAVLCPFPEAGAVLPAARPGWGGALSPAPGDLLDLQPSRVGRRLSLAAGIVLRSRVFISWVLVPPAPPTPVPHSKKKNSLAWSHCLQTLTMTVSPKL